MMNRTLLRPLAGAALLLCAAASGAGQAAGPARCELPALLASVPPAASDRSTLTALCTPGKTPELLTTAAAWLRAEPDSAESRTWISQALYIRALESDGLHSPCAPDPVWVDPGPPPGAAEAILYGAQQYRAMGWDRILRSEPSRQDAALADCFATASLAVRFDRTTFVRHLRILIDLGRDEELRAAVEAFAHGSDCPAEGVAPSLAAYIVDYLGVGREIEAGEFVLLLRQLQPSAASSLEPFREAIVLQIRRAYSKDSPERAAREQWIAAHQFDQRWSPAPPARRSSPRRRKTAPAP